MKFFLLMITLLIYSNSGFAKTARLYHRLEANSGIADIFQRLNLYPLFGRSGYITKTLKLNPLIEKIGQENLPKGFLVRLPPLPIKESKDWIIKDDLLIFTTNNPKVKVRKVKKIKKVFKSWDFIGKTNFTMEKISLVDSHHRIGTVKVDKSWGFGSEVIYKKLNRSFHVNLNYDNFVYSDGPTINWFNRSAKRIHYQLSIQEKLNSNLFFGFGLGKSDLLSFKSVGSSTLRPIKKSRLYAKLKLGYEFSFFIPVYSSLDFSTFETLEVENVQFEIGYEVLLSLRTIKKLRSGTELIFFLQAGHRDEAPRNFKQTSKFISLGLGFRWGIK